MLQSYKTIKRAALSNSFLKLLFFAVFWVAFMSISLAQTIGGKRGVQFFSHFTYRFQVPEAQVEAIRDYLQQKFPNPAKPGELRKKEIITEIYFDDEKQTLLKQNSMLRHWMNISKENRKERIQLVLPAERNSVAGKEVVFRHNRKPDIGDKFTAHPLLKLLRNKDRAVLDSLLKPLTVQASDLKPVLEITLHREQFNLQKNNSDWLVLTLTQLRPVNVEKAIWEVQIIPDRKLLAYGAPDVKKELMQQTNNLAGTLQKTFPELQKQNQTEYAFMQNFLHKSTPGSNSGKLFYALGAIVLLAILIAFFRHLKQNTKEKA